MMEESLWLWIAVPLALIGLCLSLCFGCFTKRNMIALLAALVLNLVVIMIILPLFPEHPGIYIYVYRSIIIALIMLIDFYMIRRKTPLKESLSFTLFAATAFPIVDGLALALICSF